MTVSHAEQHYLVALRGLGSPWNFVQHFSCLFRHLKSGEVMIHGLIKSIPREVSAFEDGPPQRSEMRSGGGGGGVGGAALRS